MTGGERRARKQVYSIIVGSMWRKGESSVLAKYNDTEDKSGPVIGSDGVDGETLGVAECKQFLWHHKLQPAIQLLDQSICGMCVFNQR